jgi:hypothetical protein
MRLLAPDHQGWNTDFGQLSVQHFPGERRIVEAAVNGIAVVTGQFVRKYPAEGLVRDPARVIEKVFHQAAHIFERTRIKFAA